MPEQPTLQHLVLVEEVNTEKNVKECYEILEDSNHKSMDGHRVQSMFKQGMWFAFVCFEVMLPSCLIFTMVTGIFHTFMDSLLVSLKISWLGCLMFTMVTRICHTFVNRSLMSL